MHPPSVFAVATTFDPLATMAFTVRTPRAAILVGAILLCSSLALANPVVKRNRRILSGGPWSPAIHFDDGNEDHFWQSASGDAWSITLDHTGTARARSTSQYGPGWTATTQLKVPGGATSGIVSTFYMSSLEGSHDQDEIDFEFLGKNGWAVQTNFYVNGVGGNEYVVQLWFDPSADYHWYSISYNWDSIVWKIDDEVVRTVYKTQVPAFPVKPQYVYSSLWDGSSIPGDWAGDSHNLEYAPFTLHAQNANVVQA